MHSKPVRQGKNFIAKLHDNKLMCTKRRSTKYTPAAAQNAPKATVKVTAAAKEAKKEAPVPATKKESTPEESKSGRSSPQPGPTATLKRTDSKSKAKKDTPAGDLFKSFAKAKPKAKEAEKPKEDDGMSSAYIYLNSTDAIKEPMQGMSEDEGDDDDEPVPVIDEEKVAAAKKAREERERKLQEMMEADGKPSVVSIITLLILATVDMPDAPAEEEKDSQDAPIDKEVPSKPTESESSVTVQGGRRRGRRRVMKKKKVKDEDGYLGELPRFIVAICLTTRSHERRSGLGVILRRRTGIQKTEDCDQTYHNERQESGHKRSRKHR